MKTIWKYQLVLEDFQEIEMPKASRIISTGIDPMGDLCIWAEVFTDFSEENKESKTIAIVGTGNPMPIDPVLYIGTVPMGQFVWHVYEVIGG
jgi:hypothetical protein